MVTYESNSVWNFRLVKKRLEPSAHVCGLGCAVVHLCVYVQVFVCVGQIQWFISMSVNVRQRNGKCVCLRMEERERERERESVQVESCQTPITLAPSLISLAPKMFSF